MTQISDRMAQANARLTRAQDKLRQARNRIKKSPGSYFWRDRLAVARQELEHATAERRRVRMQEYGYQE